MRQAKRSGWMGSALVLGAVGALLWLERRRPLRRSVEPRNRHDARNLAVAALAAATVRLVERPLVAPLAERAARRRSGLVPRLGLPRWAETALALALLDYTLYLWHVLTHRVPWLWRLHRMHHVDRDLTATTALRFHAVELALSAPWRAAQVVLIGVPPGTLALWQRLLLAEIVFHHANLRLPFRLERRLVRFIVTPRMHGIHHSVVAAETSANWSSGLTVWDRLHGTLRLNVPQDTITIGAPGGVRPALLRLPALLALPLTPPPPAGTPARPLPPLPPGQLLP